MKNTIPFGTIAFLFVFLVAASSLVIALAPQSSSPTGDASIRKMMRQLQQQQAALPPTVDIKVNGQDKITLATASVVNVKWTSTNAAFCMATGREYVLVTPGQAGQIWTSLTNLTPQGTVDILADKEGAIGIQCWDAAMKNAADDFVYIKLVQPPAQPTRGAVTPFDELILTAKSFEYSIRIRDFKADFWVNGEEFQLGSGEQQRLANGAIFKVNALDSVKQTAEVEIIPP